MAALTVSFAGKIGATAPRVANARAAGEFPSAPRAPFAPFAPPHSFGSGGAPNMLIRSDFLFTQTFLIAHKQFLEG